MQIPPYLLFYLAWSPTIVALPFLSAAYYLAAENGRVTARDFFIRCVPGRRPINGGTQSTIDK